MSSCKKISLQTLNIPLCGIGTSRNPPKELEQSLEWALDAGVRLIDTAFWYRNEQFIGNVISKWLSSGNNNDILIHDN